MSLVGRCAIPFPFHLCINVVSRESKILSFKKNIYILIQLSM